MPMNFLKNLSLTREGCFEPSIVHLDLNLECHESLNVPLRQYEKPYFAVHYTS